MAFKDNIKKLQAKTENLKKLAQSEQDTIRGFINPFLQALDYDISDLSQIRTEYKMKTPDGKTMSADIVILDEKANPIIVIEAKAHTVNIDSEKIQSNFKKQLQKYFENPYQSFKIAILTNGIKYYFYTNEKGRFKMDDVPFFIFDLENFTDKDLERLSKFSKENLNIKSLLEDAFYGKLSKMIEDYLYQNFKSPSKDFVQKIIQLSAGRNISKVEDYIDIVHSAIRNTINRIVSEKLDLSQEESKSPEIFTTEEEKEAFYLIKSFLIDIISSQFIKYEDTKTYLGIWIKKPDRYRKGNIVNADWIARLYLNNPENMFIEFNDSKNKKERTKVNISNIEEIVNHKKKFIELANQIKEKHFS